MKLVIQAPWRATKDEAMEDQKFLRNLFQLNHSYGYQHHAAGFEDGLNHRADCNIETDNYNIHGAGN